MNITYKCRSLLPGPSREGVVSARLFALGGRSDGGANDRHETPIARNTPASIPSLRCKFPVAYCVDLTTQIKEQQPESIHANDYDRWQADRVRTRQDGYRGGASKRHR